MAFWARSAAYLDELGRFVQHIRDDAVADGRWALLLQAAVLRARNAQTERYGLYDERLEL